MVTKWDDVTETLEAHLPAASWGRAELALSDLAAAFPPEVRVSIELGIVETSRLGDPKPTYLRGATTLTTRRDDGTVDQAAKSIVHWATAYEGSLVALSAERDPEWVVVEELLEGWLPDPDDPLRYFVEGPLVHLRGRVQPAPGFCGCGAVFILPEDNRPVRRLVLDELVDGQMTRLVVEIDGRVYPPKVIGDPA